MADDTTDMTTNDVDGAGTASEVVDVPVAGVNAGLFDRPKSEDELAGTAAGGAVAAKATVLSQKPKKSSNSAPPVNRKLLWLLAAVAVGGLAFVVLSGGDDDASPAAGSDTPSDETVVDGGTAAGIDRSDESWWRAHGTGRVRPGQVTGGMKCPPLTGNAVPVTHLASGEQKNTTAPAISSDGGKYPTQVSAAFSA